MKHVRSYDPVSTSETLCSIKARGEWQTIIVRLGCQNLAPKEFSYMTNWDMLQIRKFCQQQGWEFSVLGQINTAEAMQDLRQRGVL